MTSHAKPEALISTPAEFAECPRCHADWFAGWEAYAELADLYPEDYPMAAAPAAPTCSRFGGAIVEFAHCDTCGSTDLVDTRSPFEVYMEAVANIDKASEVYYASALAIMSDTVREMAVAQARLERMDVVERVGRFLEDADKSHCSDCIHHSVRVSVYRQTVGASR